MNFYNWLFGEDIMRHDADKATATACDAGCKELHSGMNYYTWMFDERGHDAPANETIAEHREHCKAKPGNCPFEKKIKTKENESEELAVKGEKKADKRDDDFSVKNERLVRSINKWGTSKSEEEAVGKFKSFVKDKGFNLDVTGVIQKFAENGTSYYSVTFEERGQGGDGQGFVKAFKDAGYSCMRSGKAYGKASYHVSMPGDKLLEPMVGLGISKSADDKRTEERKGKVWALSEKSQKDKDTLVEYAKKGGIHKVLLNSQINDFGGKKIPVWKALIRAHEEGWAVGELNKSEVLFDMNNPSDYLLVPKGASEYANAIGMKNEGKMTQTILRGTKVSDQQ